MRRSASTVDRSEKFSNLVPSALYLLAAPSTSPIAVDEIGTRVEAGETPSLAQVKKAIAKASPRKKRKSLPRGADEPEASTTTWTNSKAEDDEGDEPMSIERDRSVAHMSAAADEKEAEDPAIFQENWRTDFAEYCIAMSNNFVCYIDRHEYDLPSKTIKICEAAVVALRKVANSLGIDVKKREEAA
jgi:hypothetical protein